MYQDQSLTCRDCNSSFVWTASEQEFFATKGFSAPVRCAACRLKNKQAKEGGRRGDSNDYRAPREMHEIICATCGTKGEVPFKPRDPQNVLCADCFRKQREGGNVAAPTAPAVEETMSAPAENDAE